ncbi:hypothetical protein JW960_20940 [candidate division KSB1 bacterium]|nr:hypothetical protein [candidate division KSB1 bacterium]
MNIDRLKAIWPHVLLLLVAYFAFVWRLDGSLLWRDEATTACWSRSMVENQWIVPRVWDGEQLAVQGPKGHDFNDHFLPSMQSWLQFYVTAASFAVFGVSTFAARSPFALLGFLGIVLLRKLFLTLFKSEKIAWLGAAFCMVSLPYLHFARQCRYYALVLVISIALINEIISILTNKNEPIRLWAFVRIGVLGFLLFHTNYFTFGMVWCGLMLTMLNHCKRQFIIGMSITTAAVAVSVIPMLVVVHGSFLARSEIQQFPYWSDYWDWVIMAVKRVNQLIPIIPVAVLGIVAVLRYRKETVQLRPVYGWLWLMLASTLLIAVLLNKSNAFLRYYLHVIPIIMLISAITVYWAYVIFNKKLAVLLLGILFVYHSLSPVMTFSEAVVKRQFKRDCSHNGPMVDYLLENVKPEETVAFIKNEKGMVAHFYIPQLKWVALLEAQNPYNQPYKNRLPASMFDSYNNVDWVVVWAMHGLPARVERGYELMWSYRYGLNAPNLKVNAKVYTPRQYTVTEAEGGIVGDLQYYDFYHSKNF